MCDVGRAGYRMLIAHSGHLSIVFTPTGRYACCRRALYEVGLFFCLIIGSFTDNIVSL